MEKDWFTNNFIGKKVVGENGNLVSIQVLKGKVNESSKESFHQVDGISGATMTSKGVTNFLKEDLLKYEPFFKRVREKATGAVAWQY